MSVPARRVASPAPAPLAVPAHARPGVREPSPAAARPRTSVPPRPRPRARRRHPVFLVFATVLVTALVATAVSISAMLVQASFRADELHARVAELSDRSDGLVIEMAELSSPSRIARWAAGMGMVMPEEVVALTIPDERSG